MEFRIKDVDLQCEQDGLLKIGGYINVTERESEMLYSKKRGKWFKEIMKRGVFQKAINKASEIPLLFEHNWSQCLATTSNDTLSLREDNVGLRFDAIIDNEDVYEQVRSGVINSCSFGFRALDEEIQPINERLEKRFVSGIELLEVSLVKNPAYVGSLCESRSYEEELEKSKEDEVLDEETSDKETSKKEVKKEKDKKPKNDEQNENVYKDGDVEEESKEESKDEKSDPKKDEEKSEDRELPGVENVPISDETETDSPDKKQELVDIVEELIEAKEELLTLTEIQEQGVKDQLEDVKKTHKEIESGLENTSMLLSSEIVKLRLDLIKLKNIKDGI